jgi:hypothetical protein
MITAWGEGAFSDAVKDRLQVVASSIDARLTGFAGLEIPLAVFPAERVDLSVAVQRSIGGAWANAESRSGWFGTLCRAWIDPVRAMSSAGPAAWLEYDLPADQEDAAEATAVLVSLGHLARDQPPRALAVLDELLHITTGRPLSDAAVGLAMSAFGAPGGQPLQIGSFHGRNMSAWRLETQPQSSRLVDGIALAENLGWTGESAGLRELVSGIDVGPGTAPTVSLDFGEVVGPILGLGLPLPTIAGSLLVDRLIDAGLCSPAWRSALSSERRILWNEGALDQIEIAPSHLKVSATLRGLSAKWYAKAVRTLRKR